MAWKENHDRVVEEDRQLYKVVAQRGRSEMVLRPKVDASADPRYLPGEVKVYRPIPSAVTRSQEAVLALHQREHDRKAARRARRVAQIEKVMEATASELERIKRRLVECQKVQVGDKLYIPIRTVAALAECSHMTIYSRCVRLGVDRMALMSPNQKGGRNPNPEKGIEFSAAIRVATYVSGTMRGRINNPKRKAPHGEQPET